MKRILLSVFAACGVVSIQAAVFQYTLSLSGANESPANASPGTGSGTVNYDDVNHLLQMQVTFSGLIQTNVTGGTTAAHIHAATVNPFTGTAGVATQTPSFVGFPLGVWSGSFSNTLDLTLASSWNNAFINPGGGGTPATAEAALFAAMESGRAYFNVHSASLGGGEIRGFLTPVPEPSSLAFVGLGIAAFAAHILGRRRTNRLSCQVGCCRADESARFRP